MITWIKKKILTNQFKRKFVYFNSYTLQAFKLKTDKQLKEHCLNCIDKIAKDNKKDIKSVSLEDIYRVLYKIRKKTPKLLRQVTLSELEKTIKSVGTAGDISSLIYSVAGFTPVPLLYLPLKKFLGKRIKYVMITWVVSIIATEIYSGRNHARKK